MTNTKEVYDLIGIGFGPSNLALAIALKEAGLPVRVKFLEARSEFAWHPGMMIPGSDMQISFLKDLVSQRNPQSRFTFINYLYEKGRMNAFINRKTFFPSRVEFTDYLSWVASQFEWCDYDRRVCEIDPVKTGETVKTVQVTTRDAQGHTYTYHGRHLVIAPGGEPMLPAFAEMLSGEQAVFHSADYMERVVPNLAVGDRIAVVGAGQSAAEIFFDLAQRPEAPNVDLIVRGQAMKPSDDSPFVNEIFAPEQTDQFHAMPEAARHTLLKDLSGTNYAVVDEDLICSIYTMLYEQSVVADTRLRLWSRTQVTGASSTQEGLSLRLEAREGVTEAVYDKVIFATGYQRSLNDSVLRGVARYCDGTEPGRDYRLATKPGFEPEVFVQGYSERSHGLSDTLLSILPQRSWEIANTLDEVLRDKEAVAAE